MFDKPIEKIINRLLYGSKKDQKIKQLWNCLNHAHSVIEMHANADDALLECAEDIQKVLKETYDMTIINR